MATILHEFRKIQTSDKYKEVKHYEKTTSTPFNSYIEDFANISKQRCFNNSQNVAFWYKSAPRKKDDTRGNWDKDPITGLFRTSNPCIYYGDISSYANGRYKKHTFLFFLFSIDMEVLMIVEYKDFYPNNLDYFMRCELPNLNKIYSVYFNR